jgi:type I restriction-modification system DNA methylase subunit
MKIKFGEVFTPIELVRKMLNKLPIEVWAVSFLDSSCGNGNLLVEILKRKISFSQDPIEALSTIYGIDIQQDLVNKCKLRLLEIVESYIKTEEDAEKVKEILNRNIVCADALTYNWELK